MKKNKFAILGCGYIAQRHAQHISHLAELTAVCDIRPEKARELGEKYSCRYYSSLEEMLGKENELEIISICTPNNLHAPHTITALKSGKHVLCEKPMATSSGDAENMILAAARAKKNLFIVKQNRFNPPVIALKEIVDQGKLGKIFNVQLNCFWNRPDAYYQQSDWKGKMEMDGGVLFTQFSHFIDLLVWMIGDIDEVCGYEGNFLHKSTTEFSDTGVVILRLGNGALGTINYTVNSHEKNMEGSITLFGEKGTVKIGGQYLNLIDYQNIRNHTIEIPQPSRSANDYGFYQGSMSNHDKVIENVIAVLNHGHTIATSGTEGLKTVAAIEKIYLHSRSKKFHGLKVL